MNLNVSFAFQGRQVDLKYVWPAELEVLKQAVAKDQALLNAEIVQLMLRIVRLGDYVVDGGAAIGYFTVLLSKLVGQTGRIIAIEPDANSVLVLKANLELNDITNTTIIQQALWSESNLDKTLYLSEYFHANSLSPRADLSLPIPVKTTALMLYMPARLLKLDIEGSEYEALQPLCGPEDVPFIICELNNVTLPRLGRSSVELRQMMHGKGYETYLISNEGLPVHLPPHRGVVADRTEIDVLFSTPEAVSELA